jgi:hypothetical protein
MEAGGGRTEGTVAVGSLVSRVLFFFGELNQFTRAVGVVLAHCENEMFAFATHHTLTGRH